MRPSVLRRFGVAKPIHSSWFSMMPVTEKKMSVSSPSIER